MKLVNIKLNVCEVLLNLKFFSLYVKNSDMMEYYLVTDNGKIIGSSIGDRSNSQEPNIDLSLSDTYLLR